MFSAPILDSVLISLCVLHVMHFEYLILISTFPNDLEIHECFFCCFRLKFFTKKNVNTFVLFAHPFKEFWLCSKRYAYCHETWFKLVSFSNVIFMFLLMGYSVSDTCNTVFLLCPYRLQRHTSSVFAVVLPSVVNND